MLAVNKNAVSSGTTVLFVVQRDLAARRRQLPHRYERFLRFVFYSEWNTENRYDCKLQKTSSSDCKKAKQLQN